MIDCFGHSRCGSDNIHDALQILQKAPRELFDRVSPTSQSTSVSPINSLRQMNQFNARGLMLGACAGVSFITVLLLGSMALSPDARHDNGAVLGIVISVMMCSLMGGACTGLFLGNDIRSKQGAMKSYYATLPFSDRILCQTALRQAWRSSLQLWLTTIVCVAVTLLLLVAEQKVFGDTFVSQFLKTLSASFSVYPLMATLGILCGLPVTWAACAQLTAWIVFGREKFQAGAILTFFGIVIAAILLNEFGGPAGQRFANGIGVLIVVGTVLSTAGMFVMAVRKQLLPSFFAPAAICVLLGVAAITLMGPGQKPASGMYMVLASLMIMPLAALPLSIVDSRHR